MAESAASKPAAKRNAAARGPGYERFTQALRQAMVRNGLSERKLAIEMGITIGTTQKYFRHLVDPLEVKTRVTRELARLLGTTVDALIVFYETGEFRNALSFEEVSTWLRSDAGAEHLAPILKAMSERMSAPAVSGALSVRYDWPKQELDDAGVSAALRQRMGLTDEALEALATTGEFDDDLVEAFSVAVNLDQDSVREAFRTRTAVP